MAIEVIMPKVDMVMETGTFVEWLKKEGEHVNKGDPLFVITTEKAAIELESPGDGILAGVTAKPDDVIPVTEVMAYILAPGEALPTKAVSQPVVPASAPAPAKVEQVVETVAASVVTAESGKVRATPVARRMAQELGVDLSQISGRGPQGRIHKADILALQQQKPAAASAPRAGTSTVIPCLPACRVQFRCRMRAASRLCPSPVRVRSSPSAWPTAPSPRRILIYLCVWT